MRYVILLAAFLPCVAFGQTIQYDWSTAPCPVMLNCDTGCSACNRSVNASGTFIGNDLAWLGVEQCPHPVSLGDNALFSYGWPAVPDEDHMYIFTGIALTPTHIDSIIVRHRSGADGPQRLQVRFGVNENLPQEVVADVPVTAAFTNSAFNGLGTVAADETMVYGYFSLLLQPYQGQGGSWDLDALRIVGSPASFTGVPDLNLPSGVQQLPRYDALGRPVLERRSVRFYLDRSKRIVLE